MQLSGEGSITDSARFSNLPHTQYADRPIDQVVYRLYGLTEEEIAVAEGA